MYTETLNSMYFYKYFYVFYIKFVFLYILITTFWISLSEMTSLPGPPCLMPCVGLGLLVDILEGQCVC